MKIIPRQEKHGPKGYIEEKRIPLAVLLQAAHDYILAVRSFGRGFYQLKPGQIEKNKRRRWRAGCDAYRYFYGHDDGSVFSFSNIAQEFDLNCRYIRRFLREMTKPRAAKFYKHFRKVVSREAKNGWKRKKSAKNNREGERANQII
jgi:hypothetical protein